MTPRSPSILAGPLSRCVRKLAGPLGLLFSPLLVQAQSTVQWSTNFYPVTGATYPEIRESMARMRPWKGVTNMDAATVWRVGWRSQLAPTENGCQCDSIATTTTVNFTLPLWTTSSNATLTVRRQWARYFSVLHQHEVGHAQFALVAATEIRSRVKGLAPAPDCASLRRVINDLVREILDDYRRREKEYDEATAHGTRPVAAPRPAAAPAPRPGRVQ